MALLAVTDLRVAFPSAEGPVQVVRGVSLDVSAGETVALVGESGSGKSMTVQSVLGLLPPGAAAVGSVRFEGAEILHAPERTLRRLRGGRVGVVFQDPMVALNPTMTVGRQVAEVAERHLGLGRRASWAHAVDMLGRVGLPEPARRAHDYPHQFSGGMRQRAVIAIALAATPRLLIADEPTTALDVTIAGQILDLLARLQAEMHMAVILVTHDLGIVARTATRVLVMYAGQILEQGSVDDIFYRPGHPYTVGLLHSLPGARRGEGRQLVPIAGSPPDPVALPPGCSFAPRCPQVVRGCLRRPPAAYAVAGHRGHLARCWLHDPLAPEGLRWGEGPGRVGAR